jgi:hypothetical protein
VEIALPEGFAAEFPLFDPAGDDRPGTATLCWIYPNLLLALLPDHVVSIVLQPTSFFTCLSRIRLFVVGAAAPSEAWSRTAGTLLDRWRNAVEAACCAAAARHDVLAKWGTPSLPETDDDNLPIEDNAHGHHFQRYLIERILTRQDYVWNAPLYQAAVR